MDLKMAWLSWLRVMLNRLKKDNLDGAAHYLACCMEIPDCEHDVEGQRRMFSHPLVIMNAGPLWERIEPEITPEYLPEVKERLKRYGWAI